MGGPDVVGVVGEQPGSLLQIGCAATQPNRVGVPTHGVLTAGFRVVPSEACRRGNCLESLAVRAQELHADHPVQVNPLVGTDELLYLIRGGDARCTGEASR